MDVISIKAFDSPTRSVAKAISWRALGSLDTFVLSWIITGNFMWAGSIASFEVMTKMVLYYLHERGWSHIRWGLVRAGKSTAEASQQIDDPAIAAPAIIPPSSRS